jgi:hypothetical protein
MTKNTVHYASIAKFTLVHKNISVFPELFQAGTVRDAAWGCDWVGTPVPFQSCLNFIIATANKEFTLTAGKFVPISNSTMMNVRISLVLCVLNEDTQVRRQELGTQEKR